MLDITNPSGQSSLLLATGTGIQARHTRVDLIALHSALLSLRRVRAQALLIGASFNGCQRANASCAASFQFVSTPLELISLADAISPFHSVRESSTCTSQGAVGQGVCAPNEDNERDGDGVAHDFFCVAKGTSTSAEAGATSANDHNLAARRSTFNGVTNRAFLQRPSCKSSPLRCSSLSNLPHKLCLTRLKYTRSILL